MFMSEQINTEENLSLIGFEFLLIHLGCIKTKGNRSQTVDDGLCIFYWKCQQYADFIL